MRVNLPLLYDQPRAGIRNKVDRLRPEAVIRVLMRRGDVLKTRFKGLFEGDKINEEKNNGRNSNFLGFGSFLAGTSTRPGLPNPMPGKICPMS